METKPKQSEPRAIIMLFAFLIVSTALAILAGNYAIDGVQQNLLGDNSVRVGKLDGLDLSGGPANLYYDRERGILTVAGLVDDEQKRALGAVVREAPAQAAASKALYLRAIDMLAFHSTQSSRNLVVSLLLLGGISGVLGVQLRSIANFVGHASFKRDLDVGQWWPYYGIRPLTGFLLGAVIVAIIQAGFLSPEDHARSKVMWWAAVAFLAGFGDDEFTQRLRSVSRTLFGLEKNEKARDSEPEGPQPTRAD